MNRAGILSALCMLVLAGCDSDSSSTATITATRVRMEPYTAVPPGSVPRGTSEAMGQLSPPGPPIDHQLLARGRERYDVFCAPCHGLSGYGDGVVVERGFPAPPSFHSPQQQELTRARIVDVITSGFARMYPMADRIPPRERWAIAGYVKALQLSQSIPIDRLPEDLRRQVRQ